MLMMHKSDVKCVDTIITLLFLLQLAIVQLITAKRLMCKVSL